VLIFEALQSALRYVVLDSRRGLVPLWFSRKPFAHLVVLPAGGQQQCIAVLITEMGLESIPQLLPESDDVASLINWLASSKATGCEPCRSRVSL
jgi:hypothetical protein